MILGIAPLTPAIQEKRDYYQLGYLLTSHGYNLSPLNSPEHYYSFSIDREVSNLTHKVKICDGIVIDSTYNTDDRKYIKMAFRVASDWYILPFYILKDMVKIHSNMTADPSWVRDGRYHYVPDAEFINAISAFRIVG